MCTFEAWPCPCLRPLACRLVAVQKPGRNSVDVVSQDVGPLKLPLHCCPARARVRSGVWLRSALLARRLGRGTRRSLVPRVWRQHVRRGCTYAHGVVFACRRASTTMADKGVSTWVATGWTCVWGGSFGAGAGARFTKCALSNMHVYMCDQERERERDMQ